MPEAGAASTSGTVGDAVDGFRKRFDPEAAREVCAAYQFELTGPGGGAFYARVDRGRLEVAEGLLGSADVHLQLETSDLFAILAGRANADMLFMGDRIRIDGDLSLALKLRRLFP
jgi:putative sterol carrier protein